LEALFAFGSGEAKTEGIILSRETGDGVDGRRWKLV